ncbi:MAG: hypothetical protein PHV03_01810 [Desulfitobacteriaceae bacterium]|nr:hypothetical protein [Desulfitobacteriaceae bacterium]
MKILKPGCRSCRYLKGSYCKYLKMQLEHNLNQTGCPEWTPEESFWME